MIKINKQFSIEKDPQCWNLHETKEGKMVTKTTYHGNIPQVAETILERVGGNCQSVEDLKDLYENAVERIIEGIQKKIKPVRRRRN